MDNQGTPKPQWLHWLLYGHPRNGILGCKRKVCLSMGLITPVQRLNGTYGAAVSPTNNPGLNLWQWIKQSQPLPPLCFENPKAFAFSGWHFGVRALGLLGALRALSCPLSRELWLPACPGRRMNLTAHKKSSDLPIFTSKHGAPPRPHPGEFQGERCSPSGAGFLQGHFPFLGEGMQQCSSSQSGLEDHSSVSPQAWAQ